MKTKKTYLNYMFASLLVLCMAFSLGCEDDQGDTNTVAESPAVAEDQGDTNTVAESPAISEESQVDTSFAAQLKSADRIEYFKGRWVDLFYTTDIPIGGYTNARPPGEIVFDQATYKGADVKQIITSVSSASQFIPDTTVYYDWKPKDRMEFYSGNSLLGTIFLYRQNIFQFNDARYQSSDDIVP